VIKSRKIKWATHVAQDIGHRKDAGKRPLERPRRRGKDNIKMDVEKL
jgi:hypothetical protein